MLERKGECRERKRKKRKGIHERGGKTVSEIERELGNETKREKGNIK